MTEAQALHAAGAARAQRPRPHVPGAGGQVRRGRRGRRGVREAREWGCRRCDGAVILWDVVAETGLFRLLGHRVPVTGVSFFRPGGDAGGIDGQMTSGAD